ncbi:MAG: bifunctional metallophosphatase/5'-nucleotidase, partial [Bacteroidales bacterium]|nr:bifunctional metallophosphatase/5'-nucleotidase [Bacteroidales bacterium]
FDISLSPFSYLCIKHHTMLKLLPLIILMSLLTSCDSFVQTNDKRLKTNGQSSTAQSQQPITILYDNDVHCAVDGYTKLVALRDIIADTAGFVTTVSCGDFASGGVIASVSDGELIVDIMNKVDYDVVTLGNHELDYGMKQLFALSESLNAEVVCANLKNVQTDEFPFPTYHIISYGDIDVAFLGFTTPSSGTVMSLSDEDGNPLYSFMREDFYSNAQSFIDEARDNGAEYVVALTHLGDSKTLGDMPNSTALIANTTGLDAVIDGHDHHVIEERWLKNKDDEAVLLTSSGFAFENVGLLTINPNGSFSSRLVNIKSDSTLVDAATQHFVDSIKMGVEQSGRKVVGFLDKDLDVCDESGKRLVRKQQTEIGAFCANAFRVFTGADVALINGGGIRAGLKKGEVTLNDLLAVMPFGNMVCTATMTGQQLLDAMEFSVALLPHESGAFLQVSGMRYDVDVSIPTPVVISDDHHFSHVKNETRRISNLKILDPVTGVYDDVEIEKIYTVASFDYLITEMGSSGILRHAKYDGRYWGTELEVLAEFFKSPRH